MSTRVIESEEAIISFTIWLYLPLAFGVSMWGLFQDYGSLVLF